MSNTRVVLKLGGELLENPDYTRALAAAIAGARALVPLAIVHGGGREIDATLAQAGVATRQVDGVRVTSDAALAVVVPVLAGAVNTRLTAAITAAGGRAVGLTGADADVAAVDPMPPLRSVTGELVLLGRVGRPRLNGQPRLLLHLLAGGYTPVVASIGADDSGALCNVNADTMAAAVAAGLSAARLVIAGTTPGVIDGGGLPIEILDAQRQAELVTTGTITRGMLAKLEACRLALAGGVPSVAIIDGRDSRRLHAALISGDVPHGYGTQVVP